MFIKKEEITEFNELTAGLLHELISPLDGIIRYTNLSLDYLGEDNPLKDYLLEIKSGLNRITRTLRYFSSLYHNSITDRFVDINKAIEDTIIMMKNYFLLDNIEIRKIFTPDLPLILDLGIRLVFSNILKNSIDALGLRGGVIEIYTEKDKETIKISFSDNGSGITSDIKEKIFEPFFTTKSKDKGSGLGLAICKRIVDKYGGRLTVESEKNKGAIFIIHLPIFLETPLSTI
ncbi:MAG: HAMP domain-containing histidine kinase [Candidatus Omnitrophica bacterium]|nr:HAMP domain-containing histidine kinase [Candidatus Omnitrophota bacterium]MCM8827461.1 HAMP domain-containing histidine kinase [Candidatus Omnitrophota bacterium]